MNSGESDRAWYERAFGEIYPLIYAHRDDAGAALEIDGLRQLIGIRDTALRILDVGCGTGRHSSVLKEYGNYVVGLDFSPALLRRAKTRKGLYGRLIRGDMRYIPLNPYFDVVVNLFTSFGYFLEDEENWSALREMCRVLRPGGCLVLDHINRIYLEKHLVESDRMRGKSYALDQRRRIRGNRIEKDVTVLWDNGSVDTIAESVRLYEPDEITTYLTEYNMKNIRICGTFDGAPFSEQTSRMIICAEKEGYRGGEFVS
jgi:SAM-dependent methyltransferase